MLLKIKLSLKNRLDIISFIHNRENVVLGLKDPRMLLTWNVWKPYLKNYVIVAVFRHRASVTKSLYARNRIDEKLGNKLWNKYSYV